MAKGWRKIGKVKRRPNTLAYVDASGNVYEKPIPRRGKKRSRKRK